jgi:hypothetical protein
MPPAKRPAEVDLSILLTIEGCSLSRDPDNGRWRITRAQLAAGARMAVLTTLLPLECTEQLDTLFRQTQIVLRAYLSELTPVHITHSASDTRQ